MRRRSGNNTPLNLLQVLKDYFPVLKLFFEIFPGIGTAGRGKQIVFFFRTLADILVVESIRFLAGKKDMFNFWIGIEK